jgi:hypothetical protein
MTTQRTTKTIALAAGLLTVASAVPMAPVSARAAGPFDGSVPLLCAAIDLMECAAGGECQRRTAEDVNLPRLLTLDFKAQSLVAADDSNRTAPIQRVERVNGRLILQGGQEGRAWSVVIEEATGKLSAGVVDQQGAFAVFGVCTTR